MSIDSFEGGEFFPVTRNVDFLGNYRVQKAQQHAEAIRRIEAQIQALQFDSLTHSRVISQARDEIGRDKQIALKKLGKYANGSFLLTGSVVVEEARTKDPASSLGRAKGLSIRNLKKVRVFTGEVFEAYSRSVTDEDIEESLHVSDSAKEFATQKYAEELEETGSYIYVADSLNPIFADILVRPFLPAVELGLSIDDAMELGINTGAFRPFSDGSKPVDCIAYLADVMLEKIKE